MQRPYLALLVALACAGCVSPPSEKNIIPFTQAERAQFYKAQRSPQIYGLTVYNSDNGPVVSGAHRLHTGHFGLFNFDGAPVLTICPAKVPLRALVDTSSADNWITSAASASAGLVPLAPPAVGRRPDHVVDDMGGMLSLAPKVRMEDIHVENALFYTRAAKGPLGALARGVAKPAPEAVLGAAFLGAFSHVQLDLGRGRIFFSATQTFVPAEESLVASVPLTYVEGALACAGVVDGQATPVLLDTAGNFALAVKSPVQPETRQTSIGDLVFRKLPTVSTMDLGLGLENYPRLGRQVLERFVVTFDMRRKVVHFERPAER